MEKTRKIAKKEKLEKLPWELMIMEILTRLPTKSLIRFRCVNKTWLQLLTTDTYFTNLQETNYNPNHPGIIFRYKGSDLLHFTSHYKPIDKAKVLRLPFPNSSLNDYNTVAICNGLICLTDAYFNMYIWNPSIQEYITIPSRSPNFASGKSDVFFGFGVHQGTNEYKAIRIVSSCQKNTESQGFQSHVSVYTLGTNSWRILPDCLYGMKFFYEPSVLVNGTLHWLASTTLGSNLIVSFDMKDEILQDIPLPLGINSYHYCAPSVKLSGMGGYLSLSYSVQNYNVHIWQMKEYGVVESWTLQHVIGQNEIPGSFSWLLLVGAVNDKEIILTKSMREIILYNPKTKSVRNLYSSQIVLTDAYTYVGSLVSPKAIIRHRNVLDTKLDAWEQKISCM